MTDWQRDWDRRLSERERRYELRLAEGEPAIGRLKHAYFNFSMVHVCHEFSKEFGNNIGDQKIGDDDWERAQAAIRTINQSVKTRDRQLAETALVEANKLARAEFLGKLFSGNSTVPLDGVCSQALKELTLMSATR